ncbi:phosphatase PAP2 family protein [Desulfotruncus alcoholivorax]|uniref:phosphatase PAP2 family protein n=1 Tax=Desulfotruncus alcoholivorax TaxID=265477 RepID=UPI000416FCDA|nr:phosphatase PAP2 family protein [Desulfotruncus alcoholivorax]
MYRYRRKPSFLQLLPAGILAIFFAVLARAVVLNKTTAFDNAVIQFIRQFTDPYLTSVMKNITLFGNTGTLYVLVPAFVILFLITRRPVSEPLILTVSTLGGWFLIETLKNFFHRSRPGENPLVPASGFSFPSGHALMGIVVYGCLALIIYSYFRRSSSIRRLIALVAVVFIIMIGISRIYLGVHYPTDILGGYAVGLAWLNICFFAKKYFSN